MMLIPGLIAALIGLHLYLVTKLGISAPPWMPRHAGRAGREGRSLRRSGS